MKWTSWTFWELPADSIGRIESGATGEQFDVNGRLKAMNEANEKGSCRPRTRVSVTGGRPSVDGYRFRAAVRREKWPKHRGIVIDAV